jgi:hypothetical protein
MNKEHIFSYLEVTETSKSGGSSVLDRPDYQGANSLGGGQWPPSKILLQINTTHAFGMSWHIDPIPQS